MFNEYLKNVETIFEKYLNKCSDNVECVKKKY